MINDVLMKRKLLARKRGCVWVHISFRIIEMVQVRILWSVCKCIDPRKVNNIYNLVFKRSYTTMSTTGSLSRKKQKQMLLSVDSKLTPKMDFKNVIKSYEVIMRQKRFIHSGSCYFPDFRRLTPFIGLSMNERHNW